MLKGERHLTWHRRTGRRGGHTPVTGSGGPSVRTAGEQGPSRTVVPGRSRAGGQACPQRPQPEQQRRSAATQRSASQQQFDAVGTRNERVRRECLEINEHDSLTLYMSLICSICYMTPH